MATKTLLQNISSKTETGEMTPPVSIGVDFDNVVDAVSQYTLKQFFENYKEYMSSADFIYYGENTPTNKNIKLWIDTKQS